MHKSPSLGCLVKAFCLTKEENSDTRFNKDEPQGPSAREVGQSQKDICCVIGPPCEILSSRSQRQVKKEAGGGGGEGGRGVSVSWEQSFSVARYQKLWGQTVVMDASQCECA